MEIERPPTKAPVPTKSEERDRIISALEERLERHNDNRKAIQNKLSNISDGLRAQINELEERISQDLEMKFTPEDNRFQEAYNELRENSTVSALQKAKAELLVEQSYEIIENEKYNSDIKSLYNLKTEKHFILERIKVTRFANIRVTDSNGNVSIQFPYLNAADMKVLSDHKFPNKAKYECKIFKKGKEQEGKEYPLYKSGGPFTTVPIIIEAKTTYGIRVKMSIGGKEGEWSNTAEFIPEINECFAWGECPNNVAERRKYIVNEKDKIIATKNKFYSWCTVTGNAFIPLNTVMLWTIKILKSLNNNGGSICIGIAPFDIDQTIKDNYNKCGWYLGCYKSMLWSGPPHNYRGKEYGPRKEKYRQYVQTGDSVGIVMDTTKGDLSFTLNGVNLGVAYEGIPLDKPLVPCVLLYNKGDSVELVTSRVEENADCPIHIPFRVIMKDDDVYSSGNFAGECEGILRILEERLEKHDTNKRDIQDKLHEICDGLRVQIDELEDRITKELEERFITEDNKFQTVLSKLREESSDSAIKEAKTGLLVEHSYDIINEKRYRLDLKTMYKLKTERRLVPELMEMKKPTNVRATLLGGTRRVSVQFTCLTLDDERVLSDHAIVNPVKYMCKLFKKGNEYESKEYPLDKPGDSFTFSSSSNILEGGTTYGVRVKMTAGNWESEWSDVAEFTPEFEKCCEWMEDLKHILLIDPMVAVKVYNDFRPIITNVSIPPNAVTSWSIGILRTYQNGRLIWVGVKPFGTDTYYYDKYDTFRCGWFLHCWSSTLDSGPPHNCDGKGYGPRKDRDEYVHTGDSVGVVMDTIKGELSFNLNNVNLGVAYEGIPLDKPLVPCVILEFEEDSVVLDLSGVEEKTEVDNFISVPSNITAKNATWDSITITWDKVSDASFYQIEIDKSIFWCASSTNSFTKERLLPDTEHNFRVRAAREGSMSKWNYAKKERRPIDPEFFEHMWEMFSRRCAAWRDLPSRWDDVEEGGTPTALKFFRHMQDKYSRVRSGEGSLVSGWSNTVKIKTLKPPEFRECVWKECPDHVGSGYRYVVNKENPSIVTMGSYNICTIIGNTFIPLNTRTSWSIKTLKSKDNNLAGIYVGVAPSDINQNHYNYDECGWYFNCYSSTLHSGPPHKCKDKEYGLRKGKENGQYVRIWDIVGVVMDTTKGDLSFVLNGVNLDTAYEGIPLDKPLVPCVILKEYDDSVELFTSEVKENVDSSVFVPSNITTKSEYWDSITLIWGEISGASFYQIEVDESKKWYVSTINSFTKRGLLPETEHSFRVRTVRGSLVSEWSSVVKGRTSKKSFESSWWKKCPDDVDKWRKYIVDDDSSRFTTKVYSYNLCTIIGNTYIPLNKVTRWSVKIHKSYNNGGNILIGITQNDINQNEDNYNKCGWYFNCYCSTLCSGPPHSYRGKEYGPRKERGQYVYTGDSVGIVVDTTKGELSFVLNGVNRGVAYCGIPLDKPLVPCVILGYSGDSVELLM